MFDKTAIVYGENDLRDMIFQAVAQAMAGYQVAPILVPEEKLLTSRQVCEKLKITPMTLSNWRSAGKIKSYKIGKNVRFKSDEIEAAMIAQVPLKHKRVKR